MSAQPEARLSPAEYLAIERQAETKSEFYDGRMYAMSGASRRHNLIAMNVSASIHGQFKGRPCEVYSGDMRVKIPATGLYTYPDVVAVCGEPQLEDAEVDTLLNAMVIFEVLSRSTESYDRDVKFGHYERIDTLAEYVLISQDKYQVEHFIRNPDGQDKNEWVLRVYRDLEDVVEFPSINCRLSLADIYDKVDITPRRELRAVGGEPR